MQYDIFLKLVRRGLGIDEMISLPSNIDWTEIKTLAERQGLSSIILDGIVSYYTVFTDSEGALPLRQKLEWIGEVLQNESIQKEQQNTAEQIAELFHKNGIRTYVLKGAMVAECYPKPLHRLSADFDCFLFGEDETIETWEVGNQLIEKSSYRVDRNHYKNSTFYLPNLMVENHRFMVPFRGNERLRRLEILLQGILKKDKGENRLNDTWLYRPPVMVTALFLIEHAYSHFMHEGLTWKMVLDWMLYSRKHKSEIDWYALDVLIDEYGFRKFYDSYYKLGQYLLGEIDKVVLTKLDKRMLDDVWSALALPESSGGLISKLSIARNTLRARRKYHYFAEITMLQALYIQVKGYFFLKNPTLN